MRPKLENRPSLSSTCHVTKPFQHKNSTLDRTYNNGKVKTNFITAILYYETVQNFDNVQQMQLVNRNWSSPLIGTLGLLKYCCLTIQLIKCLQIVTNTRKNYNYTYDILIFDHRNNLI